MKRAEQFVGWLVKAAFIIATGHATLGLMGKANPHAPLVAWSGVVLIEGVLLHYWLLVEYGTNTRKEVRAKNVAMAWVAFFVALAAGAATGKPINVLVRIAAALGLFNSTSDVLLGWLSTARSSTGAGNKQKRLLAKAVLRQGRRVLRQASKRAESQIIEQASKAVQTGVLAMLLAEKPAASQQKPAPQQAKEKHSCPSCGRVFANVQALNAHSPRKCEERLRVDGREAEPIDLQARPDVL